MLLLSLFLVNCSTDKNKDANQLPEIQAPISSATTKDSSTAKPAELPLAEIPIVTIKDTTPTHVKIGLSYVGVKEATGHNDGKEVEMFLKSVGRRKGDSWCAAYGSFTLTEANKISTILSPTIRSGLAQAFKKDKNTVEVGRIFDRKNRVRQGDILIWQNGNLSTGHWAMAIEDWDYTKGKTVEGNTSSGKSGSQSDGDGVYIRTRTILKTAYFRIKWKVPVIYKKG